MVVSHYRRFVFSRYRYYTILHHGTFTAVLFIFRNHSTSGQVVKLYRLKKYPAQKKWILFQTFYWKDLYMECTSKVTWFIDRFRNGDFYNHSVEPQNTRRFWITKSKHDNNLLLPVYEFEFLFVFKVIKRDYKLNRNILSSIVDKQRVERDISI